MAAIHVEDQISPKHSGLFADKSLVPFNEAAEKIRAAVTAKTDPDFMIIARCDAMSVGGFDEVARRCTTYHEAGTDRLFVEAPNSIGLITKIRPVIPGTHLFNMSAGGSSPADHQ